MNQSTSEINPTRSELEEMNFRSFLNFIDENAESEHALNQERSEPSYISMRDDNTESSTK